MNEKSTHLNDEQILLALVDENDLSGAVKDHLWTCPSCREKQMGLFSELQQLGERARDYAPLPGKRPVLGLREARLFSFRRPIFAAGVAVVLVIVCLGALVMFTDPSKQMVAQLPPDMHEDVYLVDDFVGEPTLPDYYLDIAVSSSGYLDDEFLGFVAPLGEEFKSDQ